MILDFYFVGFLYIGFDVVGFGGLVCLVVFVMVFFLVLYMGGLGFGFGFGCMFARVVGCGYAVWCFDFGLIKV